MNIQGSQVCPPQLAGMKVLPWTLMPLEGSLCWLVTLGDGSGEESREQVTA